MNTDVEILCKVQVATITFHEGSKGIYARIVLTAKDLLALRDEVDKAIKVRDIRDDL